MSEKDIMQAGMVRASQLGHRLFRNNTCMAWAGQVIRPKRLTSYMLSESDVIIKNARPIHAGLCPGSSDTIGWTTKIITPEMVGQKIAQFTACEFKDKGGVTGEQVLFISAVTNAGGKAFVARSIEDVVENMK